MNDGMTALRWGPALAICAAVLSGCTSADEKWENPSAAQQAWEVHEAECRRLAGQRAEREFAPVEPGFAETFGRQTAYHHQVARFDAAERREYLFERCMKDRGYRRAARPAPAGPAGAAGAAP